MWRRGEGANVVQKYYIVFLNNRAPPHFLNHCAPVVKTLSQYNCDACKITVWVGGGVEVVGGWLRTEDVGWLGRSNDLSK